jgi:hypothetical protein
MSQQSVSICSKITRQSMEMGPGQSVQVSRSGQIARISTQFTFEDYCARNPTLCASLSQRAALPGPGVLLLGAVGVVAGVAGIVGISNSDSNRPISPRRPKAGARRVTHDLGRRGFFEFEPVRVERLADLEAESAPRGGSSAACYLASIPGELIGGASGLLRLCACMDDVSLRPSSQGGRKHRRSGGSQRD